MICPRCSREQADGFPECLSCGVIFARFEALQERAWKESAPKVLPPEPPARVSPVVTIVLLAVVVLLGSIWTASRRSGKAAREKRAVTEMKEKMDRINAEMSANERRHAEAAAKAQAKVGQIIDARRQLRAAQSWTGPPPVPGRVVWPEGLSEQTARNLIERCRAFRESASIGFPKAYDYLEQGAGRTALEAAVKAGLLRLDVSEPPRTVVIVPAASWTRLPIRDVGDDYVLDFGRPRIAAITGAGGSDGRLTVHYSWSFENGDPSGVLVERGEARGHALLRREATEWRAVNASASWMTHVEGRCD